MAGLSLLNLSLTTISVFFSLVSVFQITNYKAQTEQIEEYIASRNFDEIVTKTVIDKDTLVYTGPNAKAGFIFYPGANVEYIAYEPLMYSLASKGFKCVLLKMNFDFAMFSIDAAKGIKEKFPEIKNWYIGGHSLGGVCAAVYAYNHLKDFKGIVFLASYPINDFAKKDIKMLSLYGSDDKVLNMNSYNIFKKFFSKKAQEYVIEGGIHSYFGMYGLQNGDGTPSIGNVEQIEYASAKIAELEN